jgi:hypothetical protein
MMANTLTAVQAWQFAAAEQGVVMPSLIAIMLIRLPHTNAKTY